MRSILIVLAASCLWIGCQTEQESSASNGVDVSIPFRKDGTLDFMRSGESYLTIDIEVADTDSAIVRGLMQRTSMPDRSGMLFLMPTEELQSFWMSNTQISLDIIFVNEQNEIVHIAKYTTPLSPNSVSSEYPARYVLETIAGFTDTNGVIEGDKIDWQRDEN